MVGRSDRRAVSRTSQPAAEIAAAARLTHTIQARRDRMRSAIRPPSLAERSAGSATQAPKTMVPASEIMATKCTALAQTKTSVKAPLPRTSNRGLRRYAEREIAFDLVGVGRHGVPFDLIEAGRERRHRNPQDAPIRAIELRVLLIDLL